MENPTAYDTGQGNLSGLGFEVFCHAVHLLAAIGPVPASRPVVEQHRQFPVLRGRDRTGSLVDHKTAIIVLFIITSKKPFGNLPEVVVQLLSTAIHILGIDLHLVGQLLGEGGKQNILRCGDGLPVIFLVGTQGLAVCLLNLCPGPQPLGNDRKGCFYIICKTAQHVIGNTKDTVCHQHPLVDQLQLANIGKVVLVDEGH